ncbi:MAG: hypothetical protein IH889_02110 [Planctomycetes bacterium]|nr:hypothetical protein [Planctomycetota bacterium]
MLDPATIPDEAKRCPTCRYNLTATIDAGLLRCPECGYAFTLHEFTTVSKEGRLIRLRHDEKRISGRRFVLMLLLLILVLVIMGVVTT